MLASRFALPARYLCVLFLVLLGLAACRGDDPQALVAKARNALARNEVKAAIIQAKNALQKSPNSPEARYLLGAALVRDGDAAGGETELRKALALAFPMESVAPVLAQALLAQRQHRRVISEFGDIQLSGPANQASLKASLAAAYAVEGEADASQAALGAALTAEPNHVPALLIQAKTKAAERDFDAALATVESILAREPGNLQAWQLKGDLLWKGKGQGDEALAAYRKVIELKPEFAGGHVAVLDMLVRQGKLADAAKQLETLKKLAPNSVQFKYFETLLAFENKDFKLANDLARQLIVLAPADLRNLQLAGIIALQANDIARAQDLLSRVIKAAPQASLARRSLAAAYLRGGQAAQALEALKPALQGGEPDATTSSLAGHIYRRLGDVKSAETYFALAARLAPKDTRARTSLALTHLAAGNREEAMDELQEVAASSEGDITADVALITARLLHKDFDQAFKAIDALEAKQPDKPLAASLRGRALMMKRDFAGARKSLERAVAIDPGYFPAIESLAVLDMAEKKPDEARQRLEALLTKAPKHVPALLALARLKSASGAPNGEVAQLLARAVAANPLNVTPRLMLVEFHLRHKDFAKALEVARDGVTALPSSPMLLDALGRAQLASGDLRQAIVSYTKEAALQPQSPLAHLRLAEAHLADKNKTEAAASLRKALGITPDLLDAQRGLIALAMGDKDFPAALQVAKTVQKQRPKQAAGYLLESQVTAAQGKFDETVAALRTGLKLEPSPDLAKRMHAALRASSKAAEADRFAAAWLKDHPKDAPFRLYLGDMAAVREDFIAAEKLYASVTQLEPASAVAFNNLAWVSGKLKRSGAPGYAERAIALAPDQAEPMDTLAMLLSEKGDYAKALEWQNKALARQPENPSLRLNLAKIHLKGGNKDLARKELDALAKLGDKFPRQVEVARLLSGL